MRTKSCCQAREDAESGGALHGRRPRRDHRSVRHRTTGNGAFATSTKRLRECLPVSPVGKGMDMIGQNLWEMYPDILGTRFEKEMRRAPGRARARRLRGVLSPPWRSGSEQRCYPLPGRWAGGDLEKHHLGKTRLRSASTIISQAERHSRLIARLYARPCSSSHSCSCRTSRTGVACSSLDEHRELQQLAVAHVDPAKVQWAWTINRRYPVDMNAPTGAPNVLRTGMSELFEPDHG